MNVLNRKFYTNILDCASELLVEQVSLEQGYNHDVTTRIIE